MLQKSESWLRHIQHSFLIRFRETTGMRVSRWSIHCTGKSKLPKPQIRTLFSLILYARTLMTRSLFTRQVRNTQSLPSTGCWRECLDNCKVVGVLKTDLSSIPRLQFDKEAGKDGQDYYVIRYTIIAKFGSADIHMEFIFKGSWSHSNWLWEC